MFCVRFELKLSKFLSHTFIFCNIAVDLEFKGLEVPVEWGPCGPRQTKDQNLRPQMSELAIPNESFTSLLRSPA